MKTVETGKTVLSISLEAEKRKRTAFKLARSLVFFLIFLLLGSELFAAEGIAVLDTAGEQILNLIGARWVKALLAVALIVEFGVIAFGNAQGEGAIIKKVLPWIIGTAGVLGATSIVNYFFKNVTQESLGVAERAASLFNG